VVSVSLELYLHYRCLISKAFHLGPYGKFGHRDQANEKIKPLSTNDIPRRTRKLDQAAIGPFSQRMAAFSLSICIEDYLYFRD
jgi:hypothetical protein